MIEQNVAAVAPLLNDITVYSIAPSEYCCTVLYPPNIFDKYLYFLSAKQMLVSDNVENDRIIG